MREPHTYDPVTKRLNVDSMYVRVVPQEGDANPPLWRVEWGYYAKRTTLHNVASAVSTSVLWEPESEAHEIAATEWRRLLRDCQLADEDADRALRRSADVLIQRGNAPT